MRGGRSTVGIGLSKFIEEREPNGEQAGGGKAGPAWRGLAEFDEGLEEGAGCRCLSGQEIGLVGRVGLLSFSAGKGQGMVGQSRRWVLRA